MAVDPILDDTYADAFSVLSVASWWCCAAPACSAKRSDRPIRFPASSLHYSHQQLPHWWFPSSACLTRLSGCKLREAHRWLGLESPGSGFEEKESLLARPAINGSMWFATAVGVVTSMLVTLSIVFNLQILHFAFGPAGLIVSVLSVVLWCLGWLRLPFQSADVDATASVADRYFDPGRSIRMVSVLARVGCGSSRH